MKYCSSGNHLKLWLEADDHNVFGRFFSVSTFVLHVVKKTRLNKQVWNRRKKAEEGILRSNNETSFEGNLHTTQVWTKRGTLKLEVFFAKLLFHFLSNPLHTNSKYKLVGVDVVHRSLRSRARQTLIFSRVLCIDKLLRYLRFLK